MGTIEECRFEMLPVVSRAQKKLEKLTGDTSAAAPLRRLRKDKRQLYERMFDLIYQCSANRVAAKTLVDRILERI